MTAGSSQLHSPSRIAARWRALAVLSAVAVVLLASLQASPASAQTANVPPVITVVVTGPARPATYQLYVLCQSSFGTADYRLTFSGPGSQTLTQAFAGSVCRVVDVAVPGYTPNDIDVSYNGPTVVFAWRPQTPTPVTPGTPTSTTVQLPVTSPVTAPVVLRAQIEVVGVDFGSQTSGAASAPRDAIVRNRGQVAVSVTRSSTEEPFAVTGGTCAAGPIAPEAECTVTVVARPPVAGSFERVLVVEATSTSGTARGQAAVRVQGSDVERLGVGGATFGQVAVGTASTPQNVPVTNAGSLPARISRIAVTGPFQLRPSGCQIGQTLGPGQACEITVVYVPTAGGGKAARSTSPRSPPRRTSWAAASSPGRASRSRPGCAWSPPTSTSARSSSARPPPRARSGW